ncbi:ATP-binding protein [Spirulina sp. 06S082]|uniref:ATP-binding protein n=1 Tax=Spirulina sp. 06S082 TaxID=3110248 RepID=UPI002B1F974E|nr:ATP-binding protein [Spirulina sp. 06S082]MEA5468623.1 ATP-binding protein [Spirulina sp. 06S082]
MRGIGKEPAAAEEAIAYHREGLEYAKQCRDPVAESDALKGLGETHWHLYEFEETLQYYKQCRKKAKAIGEVSLAGQALRGLGMTAYDNFWVGREHLIAELSTALNSRRLLMILGLTGMGKTALAERLVAERYGTLAPQHFQRANFENAEHDKNFASIALQWLEASGISS